jgi:hypothetical protein
MAARGRKLKFTLRYCPGRLNASCARPTPSALSRQWGKSHDDPAASPALRIGPGGSDWGFAAIGDFVRNTTTDFVVRDTGSDAMMVGSVIDGATSFTSVYPGWNPAG